MMNPKERRLERLEGEHGGAEGPKVAEKRRKEIRQQAEHANRCQDRYEDPLFEITEEGDVLCARDGRPVTHTQQTLAEKFYLMELGWGGPGLVHDPEAEAFYTPEGDLALSRDFVHLERLMGEERMKAWESECA